MAGLDDKEIIDPSTTSMAWDVMIGTWTMVETLLGGTKSMRAAGSVYLPQHMAESDTNYNERLDINVLFNALELTLDHFVGRPFSDPVRLNTDVPENISDSVNNIDLQGNDITEFCRAWFRESLAKGFSHVMVDMPQMTPEARINRTLESDRKEGRRPFWLLIKPENMIFAEANLIVDPQSGELREWFTHVRIRENIVERVGFAERVRERIRVIEPGFFQVWEKIQPVDRRKKIEWRVIEEGATGIPFIPIITYYSNRNGFMTSKAPLEDLAYLNIRHWQSMSDQINILTVVRFPMLAVSGAVEGAGNVMKIGPRQLLATKDPNGKFYYVEHKGESIEAGWDELQKLEEDMQAYGSTLLRKETPDETAEGRKIDNTESVSALEDMVTRFMDSVNGALRIHATWLGLNAGGTVTITSDFGPETINETLAVILMDLRKDRDISRLAVIKRAKQLGVIPEDYDPEADFEQLVLEDRLLKPLQPQIPGTFDPSEEDNSNKAPNAGGQPSESAPPKDTDKGEKK